MNWDDALRRIRDGEDVEAVLDEKSLHERAAFVVYLRDEVRRPDLAEKYLAEIKAIDSGISGARSTWHSISDAQRRALEVAAKVGGRLTRCGKDYRLGADGHFQRTWPHPIRVATIRNLCSRDLMAWDGGAFDPEAVVVITERGLFVLKHGEAKSDE